MKTKIIITLLSLFLLISVFFNVKPDNENYYLSFSNANTRSTYDTYHKITEAHQFSTGKGVKVGVLGKYFGCAENKELYAGGKDFLGDKDGFEHISEHGKWMSTTLKEIAPDVEIYALNVRSNDKAKQANAMVKAINWAIENDLDVLTYSAELFNSEYRAIVDEAIRKAVEYGIIPTFIHYDLPENILPIGFFSETPAVFNRNADVNIFHMDYNLLLLFKYRRYIKLGASSWGDVPYFSNSSMSVVLGGIVAMMKELEPDLHVKECKEILIKTSKVISYNGYEVKRVVNAKEALDYLIAQKQ